MDLTAVTEADATGARPRVDRLRGLLIGSTCPRCRAGSWPSRSVCHRCGAPMAFGAPLAPEGTLLSYTTVHVPRAGLDVPYTLGQVLIGDVILFAHVRGLDAKARVPLPVAVVVPPEREGPLDFWFRPATSP